MIFTAESNKNDPHLEFDSMDICVGVHHASPRAKPHFTAGL
jgi:hypothetical protein